MIKNHFASEYIYNEYRNEKTCGVIEHDPMFEITKIAQPVGVIAAIVPTTNSTLTAIFKALIALKLEMELYFSSSQGEALHNKGGPNRSRRSCSRRAAKGIIGWIDEPTIELSMSDKKL